MASDEAERQGSVERSVQVCGPCGGYFIRCGYNGACRDGGNAGQPDCGVCGIYCLRLPFRGNNRFFLNTMNTINRQTEKIFRTSRVLVGIEKEVVL
jgi:hypothetical protein